MSTQWKNLHALTSSTVGTLFILLSQTDQHNCCLLHGFRHRLQHWAACTVTVNTSIKLGWYACSWSCSYNQGCYTLELVLNAWIQVGGLGLHTASLRPWLWWWSLILALTHQVLGHGLDGCPWSWPWHVKSLALMMVLDLGLDTSSPWPWPWWWSLISALTHQVLGLGLDGGPWSRPWYIKSLALALALTVILDLSLDTSSPWPWPWWWSLILALTHQVFGFGLDGGPWSWPWRITFLALALTMVLGLAIWPKSMALALTVLDFEIGLGRPLNACISWCISTHMSQFLPPYQSSIYSPQYCSHHRSKKSQVVI